VEKKWQSWVWWYTLIIPALRRLKQENQEFGANLGFIVRTCPREGAGAGEGEREREREREREERLVNSPLSWV
jgi:hypothetical protein